MEPDQMPEMPEMRGANMRQEKRPQKDMGQASPEIAAALVQRLGSMSEQELAMLDSVISPEVAQVLICQGAAVESGAGPSVAFVFFLREWSSKEMGSFLKITLLQ